MAAKAAETAEIDIARVLLELTRIGTQDMRRLFRPDGSVKPPAEWDDDLAASISAVEVTSTTTGEGGAATTEHVYKVKTWDKNSALDKIAKHLGMFIDRAEVTVHHHYHDMTDEELDRELENQFLSVRGQSAQAH